MNSKADTHPRLGVCIGVVLPILFPLVVLLVLLVLRQGYSYMCIVCVSFFSAHLSTRLPTHLAVYPPARPANLITYLSSYPCTDI